MKKVITILGRASRTEKPTDYNTAYELGRAIAEAGYLLCNGAYGQLMEATARGAKSIGGKTIGVVTDLFSKIQNQFLDETIVENSPMNRLNKFIKLSNAYIIFKGGLGTFIDIALIWDKMFNGDIKKKPIIILGTNWDSLIRVITNELTSEALEGFIKFVIRVDSVKECVDVLKAKLK